MRILQIASINTASCLTSKSKLFWTAIVIPSKGSFLVFDQFDAFFSNIIWLIRQKLSNEHRFSRIYPNERTVTLRTSFSPDPYSFVPTYYKFYQFSINDLDEKWWVYLLFGPGQAAMTLSCSSEFCGLANSIPYWRHKSRASSNVALSGVTIYSRLHTAKLYIFTYNQQNYYLIII